MRRVIRSCWPSRLFSWGCSYRPKRPAALEQRDLAQMAPVSAYGPNFSPAQDDQLRKDVKRENRGIRDGRRIFRYDTFPHYYDAAYSATERSRSTCAFVPIGASDRFDG